MALSSEAVENIAKLARLDLAKNDLPQYADTLNNILHLVDQMSAVNTDNIEAMAHPLDISQRLREDRITEHDQHQLFQSIAPDTEDQLYLVPKVIE